MIFPHLAVEAAQAGHETGGGRVLYHSPSYHVRNALSGAAAAAGIHIVLVPLDVLKTNLQLQGRGHRASASDVLRDLVARRGARGLLVGSVPTLVGYGVQGATKFGMYEIFNDLFRVREYGEASQLLLHCGTAALAELFASTALCPFEAVRIRMLVDSAGTGAVSLLHTLRELRHEKAFYRGWLPLVLKQVPYTTTQLAVFSGSTHAVYTHVLPRLKIEDPKPTTQLAISMGCGVVAGAISSIASQPGDTILTRINAARKLQLAHVEGASQEVSLRSVVRELGWKGLWLGAGTRVVLTSILSAGMFLVLDSTRLALGLSPAH